MKTCFCCKQGFPATSEFFGNDKKRKDGIGPYCLKCKRIKSSWASDRNRKKNKIRIFDESVFRKCAGCGVSKPATPDFFHKSSKDGLGLKHYCRECRSLGRDYPKEKTLAYGRKYGEVHREEKRAYDVARYPSIRGKKIEQAKVWQQGNPKKVKIRNERWETRNPEKVYLRHKRWAANNPEKRKASWEHRHLLLCLAREIAPAHTAEDWQEILDAHNYCCAYCGRDDVPMTEDHILAITNGGLDNKENINPACRSCNSSKGDRLLEDWLPKRLEYLERKAKLVAIPA